VRIGLAQLNTRVGAIDANTNGVIEAAVDARDRLGCDLVLYPELALCGYPPEDLLLHRGLKSRVTAAFETVRREVSGIAFLLGYPEYTGESIYNSAALIRDGRILANHRKQILPNYAVFDEKRYFQPGGGPTVVEIAGQQCGIIVCEDAWEPPPCRASVAAGARLVLVINGSPYHMHQQRIRESILAKRARENDVPIVYLNMMGGQDELVFDGASFAVAADGTVVFRAPSFETGIFVVEAQSARGATVIPPQSVAATLPLTESVYRALVLGTRDYVEKNGFPGVVLGLSGGVDSALTLTVATRPRSSAACSARKRSADSAGSTWSAPGKCPASNSRLSRTSNRTASPDAISRDASALTMLGTLYFAATARSTSAKATFFDAGFGIDTGRRSTKVTPLTIPTSVRAQRKLEDFQSRPLRWIACFDAIHPYPVGQSRASSSR